MNDVDGWFDALRAHYGEALTFSEIRKGVAALSRIYVEERRRIRAGVFEGTGKRAAFACFYTPLHFLLVRAIVRRLGADAPPPRRILDLGCGLAPAGTAWALAAGGESVVTGVEQHPWAARKARESLDALGLRGKVLGRAIERAPGPKGFDAVVAAFTVNELEAGVRDALLKRLLIPRGRRDFAVLIVEPIARRASAWWDSWVDAFVAAGGRADTWRFPAELPDWLRELDRAAGLDHEELTGKSLFLPSHKTSK